MKKIIFFDIDGTLLGEESKTMSESTLATLKKLQDNGHVVSLATGRSFDQAQTIAETIGVLHYVCDGGNGVVYDGQLNSYEYPNQDVLHKIMDECEKKDIPYAIQINNTNHRYHKSKNFNWNEMKTVFKNIYHYVEEDLKQLTTIKRIMLMDAHYQWVGLEELGMLCHNNRSMTVIEPVDKYKGIKKLCALLDIKEENVIVFGDGHNDMSMFLHANYAVAMGNAVDELKVHANYISDTSDRDGIQKACQYLKLIE